MLPAGTAPLPLCKALAVLAAGAGLLFNLDRQAGGFAALDRALHVLWPADDGPAARRLAEANGGLLSHTAAAAAAAAAILSSPPSPAAAALASVLERHCPEVSLAQMHTWALVLNIAARNRWLNMLGNSGEPGRPPTPECRALMTRMLQRCCLLLHSGGSEAAGLSCRMTCLLAPFVSHKPPLAAVVQTLQEGLARAKDGQCESFGAQACGTLLLCVRRPLRCHAAA